MASALSYLSNSTLTKRSHQGTNTIKWECVKVRHKKPVGKLHKLWKYEVSGLYMNSVKHHKWMSHLLSSQARSTYLWTLIKWTVGTAMSRLCFKVKGVRELQCWTGTTVDHNPQKAILRGGSEDNGLQFWTNVTLRFLRLHLVQPFH